MYIDDEVENSGSPVIKVIGVGGGGGNAINRMVDNDVKGVQFVAMNTDAQVLKLSRANVKVHYVNFSFRGSWLHWFSHGRSVSRTRYGRRGR